MKIVRPIEITDAVYSVSNIPENEHAEYSAATAYALGDRVIYLAEHQVYESLQAANTGNALTDTNWWLLIGSTNKWAMFDGKISSPSVRASSIAITLAITGEPINSVALFGMDAAELSVVLKNDVGAVVFTLNKTLVDNSAVTDWYSYFFEPITRTAETEIEIRLPTYSTGTLEITLTASGDVSVGEIVVGQSRNIGDTLYGTSVGILDFSRKERDSFGNPIVVERDFSFSVDFDISIKSTSVGALRQLLARYRATPVVWVGVSSGETYGTLVYGYYRDFDIVLANHAYSQCTIQVEGLN